MHTYNSDIENIYSVYSCSESEIDIFESVDRKRCEEEMVCVFDVIVCFNCFFWLCGCGWLVLEKHFEFYSQASWSKLVQAQGKDVSRPLLPLPPRLVTHEDLKAFFEVMKVFETPKTGASSNVGLKRKSVYGGLDTQHYGRGKRAREVGDLVFLGNT